MAVTYLRNMFNLHRYKVVFCFFFLLFSTTAFAQKEQKIFGKNLPNYDNRKMHYGFYLGATASRFNVEYSDEYVQRLQVADSSGLRAANPKITPGFTLGFVLSRQLGDFFTIRFLPGVGFYNRQVEFEDNGELVNQEVPSTTVHLPFLFKYMSKRRQNTRMYFVAGATPGIDIGGSKRDERIDNKLRVDKNNFQIEYGVGVDLFYPFFKFAPELRVAHGVPNILITDDNAYSRSFQNLRTTTVTLYLNFE
ncbi:porin family protein [Adhaeribacter terreus]|uniref:Porin family protein n=1 Tax=Adhaeribacter terreus TaxID=529703 RepID=A0ABW0EHW3_9BACT